MMKRLPAVTVFVLLLAVGGWAFLSTPRSIRISRAVIAEVKLPAEPMDSDRAWRITVLLSAADAATIADWEAYPALEIHRCAKPDDNYPADIWIERGPFDFDDLRLAVKRGNPIVLSGVIPAKVQASWQFNCARIRAQGYFSPLITSNSVRLPAF